MLPAGTQNVRLPIWSPVVDRSKLVQLAKYAKEFGVIDSLPNMTQARAEQRDRRQGAPGTVGNVFITLRLDGKAVTALPRGKYTIVVTDNSKTTGLPAPRPGREEADERQGNGAQHVDADAEEGQVRLQLDHAPEAQAHVEDHARPATRGRRPRGRRPRRYGANVCVGAITTSSSTGSSRDASVGTIVVELRARARRAS